MSLSVSDIFYSIEGETAYAGFPALFIRLSGCNLNCINCDTPEAKKNGREMSIDSIISIIPQYEAAHHITVTGGEPLIQKDTLRLLEALLEKNRLAQIETNGSVNLQNIPDGIRKIIDIKTPSSLEEKSFNTDNLKYINQNDEIKFVISDNADFTFAENFIKTKLKNIKAVMNFSPSYNKMPYNELANKILEKKLNVRLNLQLHKIIGVK